MISKFRIILFLLILNNSLSAFSFTHFAFAKEITFNGGPYPIYNEENFINELPFKLHNDEGIPFRIWKTGEKVIHPVWIAQSLLKYYGKGKLKGEKRKIFNQYIDNIINSKSFKNDSGVLIYSFDNIVGRYKYLLKSGWGSAMAQGQMLSLLARAHYNFPEKREKINLFADHLLKPLNVPVNSGGFIYKLGIGGEEFLFYAEYPIPISPPLTLNGFMFTLIGLKEYAEQANSDDANKLYKKGLKTLNIILPFYDTYPVSLYDLSYVTFKNTTPNNNLRYHNIHIKQLKYLYSREKIPLLNCIANSMELKKKYLSNIRYKIHRIYYKLFYRSMKYIPPLKDGRCKEYFKKPFSTYRKNEIAYIK